MTNYLTRAKPQSGIPAFEIFKYEHDKQQTDTKCICTKAHVNRGAGRFTDLLGPHKELEEVSGQNGVGQQRALVRPFPRKSHHFQSRCKRLKRVRAEAWPAATLPHR